MSKVLDKKIERIKDKKLVAQAKRLKKILDRALKENSIEKKKKIHELNKLAPGSAPYNNLQKQIDDIQTISDGTKVTYFDSCMRVLKEMNEAFGIRDWREIKPDKFEKIIDRRKDAGQSASTIKKVIHSINFINKHAVKTRVYKESQNINMLDYEKSLESLKNKGIKRRSSDSKRLKATYEQAERVIKEMKKYNKYYAQIARYQLLTGFRISDAIRQKAKNIDEKKHICFKSKGGLTNVIYVNHHTFSDKEFIDDLIRKHDTDTGRIFERIKDENGHFRSDDSIAKGVTMLAAQCAKKLGIVGKNGETFSSHSFRGAFAFERMKYYAKNSEYLDDIIEQKIREQPRLRKRYNEFEARIKRKIIIERRAFRKIYDYEKIQWLVSTDLNHSRQDVVRYYVPTDLIKESLKK